ncbi:MAG: ABC transporter substrate-binding protein [Chloroflexi bacterium]|nr:ABC transporter substrate-binding protein [Chloroflexota bacterium]
MPELKMAVGDRLETKFLLSGRVTIDGFDIEMVNPGPAPAPIFHDMVTSLPYDVGELTIANFVIARDQGVPIIGLPIFPNLFFPLTGVTVNRRAGIGGPSGLAGKRVGVPLGFASNPAVWLRGILEHHYGVAADSITWVEGERDSLAGVPYPRPPRFKREQRTDLEALLAAGEIDALVVAGGGSELSEGVRVLIEDPYPLLDDYVASTGAFPINTMLVMKEASVAANPGLAPAVIAASAQARALYDAEEPDDALHQGLRVGALREAGHFPRPHGLETHGKTVETLVGYLHEQGLIRKAWSLRDLFVA